MTEKKDTARVIRLRADRVLMGETLTVEVLVFPAGVEVNIYGGCLPHIGAVSIVDPDGNPATTQFSGHKDAVISEKWACALAAAGYRPVTVVAGIHYDNLTKEEIEAVVAVTDEMLGEVLEKMKMVI